MNLFPQTPKLQKLKTMNLLLLMMIVSYKIIICILHLKHRTQLNFVKQNKQNLTNGSSIISTLKLKMFDKKCLTGRWVCTRKIDNNITQLKARYVIKGFQEKSSIQSDSPTGSKKCL